MNKNDMGCLLCLIIGHKWFVVESRKVVARPDIGEGVRDTVTEKVKVPFCRRKFCSISPTRRDAFMSEKS